MVSIAFRSIAITAAHRVTADRDCRGIPRDRKCVKRDSENVARSIDPRESLETVRVNPRAGIQVKINALDRELLAPIGVDIEDLDLFRS